MYKSYLALFLSLIGHLSAVQAQSSNDRADRLMLEIEWIRTPRAVLDVDAAPKELISSATALPYADPVEIEANQIQSTTQPPIWSIEPSDKRLSVALNKWAQQAGWQLVWEADRDFLIESNLHLTGDFLKSIGAVMQSLAQTDYPLQARINSSTLTLRISRYQDAGNR